VRRRFLYKQDQDEGANKEQMKSVMKGRRDAQGQDNAEEGYWIFQESEKKEDNDASLVCDLCFHIISFVCVGQKKSC
jgi:hypothetical protein